MAIPARCRSSSTKKLSRNRRLHDRRNFDAHDIEEANKFAAHDGCGGQQESFAALVGLVEDVVAVIEVIEELRQLEGMLGGISGLGGGDALLDDVGSLGGSEPELPQFIS